MLIALLVSLLTIPQLFADCKLNTGRGVISIPENHRETLFAPGKSLQNHKTQDQDGLGTCYANSTSVVLKTVLPGNPDISYQHAAFQASTHGWETNWQRRPGNYLEKRDDKVKAFVESGRVCETVAALRKSGGACPKEFSIVENKEDLDPMVQQKVFKKLGAYFDNFNKKKNKQDVNKLKENILLVMEEFKVEQDRFIKSCEEDIKREIPSARPFQSILGQEVLNHIMDPNCGKKTVDNIRSFSSSGIVKPDRVSLNISNDFIKKFESHLEKDLAFKQEILTFIQKKEDETIGKEHSISVGKKVKAFIDSQLPVPHGCEEYGKTALNDDVVGETFLKLSKRRKHGQCPSLVNFVEVATQTSGKESLQCIQSAHLDELINAIAPLVEIGKKIDPTMLDALLNKDSKNGNQLKNILMPGCNKNANLLSLNNISCSEFNMCDRSAIKVDLSNNTYSGPKNDCYSLDRAKTEVQQRAFLNLSKGRALAVNVCTSFFLDSSKPTDFCRKAGKGVEGHSYHSMNITGYRCQKGKLQYEILNSWGKSCIVKEGEKNPAVECEVGPDKKPTGKFWVKEDVLVDSTTGVVQFLPKGNK